MRTLANLLLVSVGVAVIIGVYPCPIYSIFKIPCAGCGMTRAYRALLRFDFYGAFKHHELFPIPAMLLCYHLLRNKIKLGKKWEYVIMLGSVGALAVRYIIKLIINDNFI